MRRTILSLLLLVSAANAFVIPITPSIRKPSKIRNSNHVRLFAQQQQQQRPIVVVGKLITNHKDEGDPNTSSNPTLEGTSAQAAALGAALALCVKDLLQNPTNKEKLKTSPPPAQLVTLLACVGQHDLAVVQEASCLEDGALNDALYRPPTIVNGEYTSIGDYQQLLQSLSQQEEEKVDPMLHVIMEGDQDVLPLLDPSIRSSISFLGIQPIVHLNKNNDGNNGKVVSAEHAMHCGTMLQQLLDTNPLVPEAAISPDLSLHLSMLRANCLPKSKSAFNDSWAVRNDGALNDGAILIDYLYDFNNPFGGSDPLSCPTIEYNIPSPPSSSSSMQKLWNNPTMTALYGNAYAAAYTALRGSGMDPIPSICVASSVGAVFCKYDGCPPPYTWDVMERIAQYSQQVRENVIQDDGIMRKKYIEFGYK